MRIKTMESFFRTVGEKALKTAHSLGVEAEAYMVKSRELSIQVRDGQVETLKQAEEYGLGLRVIKKGRLGFAYSSDFSRQAVESTVADAARMAAYTSGEEPHLFPSGDFVYQTMDLYDDSLDKVTLEEKIELSRELEHLARISDKRVKITEQSGYDEIEYQVLIMNNKDLYAFKLANLCGISIFLVAEEDGDAQTGFSFMTRRHFGELSASEVGIEAAQRAVRMIKASPIESGTLPCIMEPQIAAKFLGVFAGMADGDAVQKGRSLLAGKIGEHVASQQVSIIDDSLIPGGIGSTPFDAEGVPGKKTTIAENGVLQNYLYDRRSALRIKAESTGSARRASFRSLPVVGNSNLFMEAGPSSPADMIKDISRGLYITDVMGMHTINSITGDFSIGAAGILIQNGEMGAAVRGVTVAGNIQKLFAGIDLIGNDIKYFGSRGAPSIRIQGLSVGGQ